MLYCLKTVTQVVVFTHHCCPGAQELAALDGASMQTLMDI